MVKVITFDVDGTLREPNNPVELGVVERMHQLVRYEVQVSLVSGKDAVYLFGLAEGLGIPNPLVGGENGAVIFRPQEKVEIVYPVPEEIKKSLDYVRSFLWHQFYDNIWFPPNKSGVTAFVKPGLAVDEVYRETQNFVRKHRLTELYVLPHWDAVDVMPVGLGKGVFIDYLNNIGFRSEDIVAVGDALNDIPMLESAGFSITFKSSPGQVKEVASRVVADIYQAFDIIDDLIKGSAKRVAT